jgi:hypothetical protein
VRAIRGEEADWGLGEHLLAAAVDQLAAGNWMYATAHTAEHADQPERPAPIPRPGVDAAQQDPPAATPDQITAFFGGR